MLKTNKKEKVLTENSVRKIVRKEIKGELNIFRKDFKSEVREEIEELFEKHYANYRDEVLTKMDKAIAEMKKHNEEDAVHYGQHADFSDKVDNLEAILPEGKHT